MSMKVLNVRNVCEAWPQAYKMLCMYGRLQDSRAGKVIVLDTPVITEYRRPWERVLTCPIRDANPIFHLMESLWMLAGRSDTTWLDLFVKDFSQRFGEPSFLPEYTGWSWGAYGYRWRKWFSFDQLNEIVDRLKADPFDRRIVLSMWDPLEDWKKRGKKDYPCNTQAYIRINNKLLDLTVCCRSNDIVWGAYGANAVHFSVLQEYLAAKIGVGIGTYYQFSNNFHAYVDVIPVSPPLDRGGNHNPYADATHHDFICSDPDSFDDEVIRFCNEPTGTYDYKNGFLTTTAHPMYQVATFWREKDVDTALEWATKIQAWDWKNATLDWLWRREDKRRESVSSRSV